MKHDIDEMLREVTMRSDTIIKRRETVKMRMLSGITVMLTVVLVSVVSVLSGVYGVNSQRSVYGSFLISEETGGYILVAIIAFTLGVIVTLLTQKYRRR